MPKCDEIKASQLRHKISIQRAGQVADGGGGYTAGWAEITNGAPKAKITPNSGGESFQGMRVEGSVSHSIIIRYRSGISTSDRIVFKGRVMQIKAIINIDENSKWLKILAEEGRTT